MLVTCGPPAPTNVAVPKPVNSAEPSPVARLEKSAYPSPPRQTAPWTAPKTSLDASFVSAASKLFEQGFADPRDLSYREIEITVGDVWSGGGTPLKTHGWAFVDGKFAVAWNGLVYRVKSVGAPADLRADMKAMLDADVGGQHRFPNTGEGFFVATNGMTIAKAMLLLRLGETDLAERVMKALHEPDQKIDPYYEAAEDFAWALYDRGITAHMRGDVDLAIESFMRLPDLSKRIDAECIARKIEARGNHKPGAPYISFLDGIDDVLAEEKRRAASPPARVDAAAIAAMASLPQADRIQKLIIALDDVSARQMGQPGGVALGEDPIVQALIKEGEPAVEPLIAVFENDTRLTRSVQFWRDFARYRSVLAVYEAAYVALSGILDASFFQAVSTGDHLTARGVSGRREVGKQIREHWAKWKGISLEERFYRTLMDDSAGADQWVTAAEKITQPTNVQIIPSSSIMQTSMTTPLAPGQKPTLRGEVLRTKTTPSVSALFAQRFRAMPDTRHACALAESFAAWDAKAALPHVSAFVKSAIGSWATSTDHSLAGSCIASLTSARVDGGDASALADYGAWLAKTSPKDAEYDLDRFFAPMIAHPTSPAIIASANAVFAPSSPWVPFVSDKSSYMLERILELDLWKLDAFKKHVASKLADKTKLGTITIQSKDGVHIQTPSFSSSRGMDPNDPLTAPIGTVMDLRTCDEYAAQISSSQVANAPAFKVSWRESDRDAALAAMLKWVKTR